MYERILIPTDGSRRAVRATEQGLELARKHDGIIHALYIIDTGEMGFAAVPSDIAELKNSLREKGESVLADLSEQADKMGVPYESSLESRVLPDTIIQYIENNDIDLVVMGKHGYLDSDSVSLAVSPNA